jgi:hypothetical protein
METPNSKPVKAGYKYGLILLIFGIFVVAVNVAMLFFSERYFPKLFAVGIALTLLAPIFFIFPGATLDKMPETKDMGKILFRNAPVLHKVMWIVWGVVSVAIALIALIRFDPQFFK